MKVTAPCVRDEFKRSNITNKVDVNHITTFIRALSCTLEEEIWRREIKIVFKILNTESEQLCISPAHLRSLCDIASDKLHLPIVDDDVVKLKVFINRCVKI